MTWKERWKNTDGSSMISVLVAFIILLIGVAGFAGAVTTANNLVRRAEVLNAVTGTIMEAYYREAPYSHPLDPENILPVYEVDKDENLVGADPAFRIHGSLDKKEYTAEVTGESGEKEPDITYEIYYYR